MDPNSGHLVDNVLLVDELSRGLYKRIPEWLHDDAKRELGGERETNVSLSAQTNLAQWAANQRKKSRTAAKMAKRSRRRNRA